MATNGRKKYEYGSTHQFSTFLIKTSGKLLFGISVAVLVLTLAQCTVKKPEAPEWDTKLVVPLVNRTYAMPEIIRKIDQDGLGMDADSNFIFSITRSFDTIRLSHENLSTGDLNYTLEQQIGKFEIIPPTITPVTIRIDQISGLPQVYPSAVPATSFSIPAEFPVSESFTSATIDSGKLYIVLTNNLGIPIDQVIITLFDEGQWATIGSAALAGGLAIGETDSVLFVLDGKTISNSLTSTASCHTPGGNLTDGNNKTFTVGAHFAGAMTASSATAEVPELSRTFSDSVALQDSDLITQADITDGMLSLSITNNTALSTNIEVQIPDLSSNGEALILNRQVTGYGTVLAEIPLDGYILVPSIQTRPQSLPVHVVANLLSSSPQQVLVNEAQNFEIEVSLTSLEFGSVSGYFTGTTMILDPIIRDIEVPKGFDSIEFSSAVLTLEVENYVALPGALDFQLDGNNGNNMNVTGEIEARSLATAATTEIVEPDAGTFLSPIPSQVTVSGSAVFGNGQFGTLRADDYITGNIKIESPLEVTINETTIETDIESNDIDQENIDAVTDHLLEASFIYTVTNHLPIGATLNILISSDSATLFSNPQLQFDNITINAAPVLNGIVTDTLSTGSQSITIDSADVQILKNETLYVGQELILHGTNGQVVRLMKNDFIKIIGRIEINYRFDGEF